MPRADALAVVVVAHDSAAHLPSLLNLLLAQLGEGDQLTVVDNASRDGSAAIARDAGGKHAQVIEAGVNLGFGGGCHVGASATSAPLLLFLNPDSEPQPGCLARLREAASTQPEWGAWQAAVMLPDGTINTDGGVVHFLGAGWAGDCGKPADRLPGHPSEAAFASGAAMVVRRATWDRLGGFDPSFFMYCEDLDLGLRVWLAGERVGIVPDARVVHSYEFDKGREKWFWLERNRLRIVLSVYPAPLLALVFPGLIAAELGLLAVAARNGWLGAKLRAQAAVLAGLSVTIRRRRSVQRTRRLSATAFASHLTATLDSDYLPSEANGRLGRAQAAYWRAVRRLLGIFAR